MFVIVCMPVATLLLVAAYCCLVSAFLLPLVAASLSVHSCCLVAACCCLVSAFLLPHKNVLTRQQHAATMSVHACFLVAAKSVPTYCPCCCLAPGVMLPALVGSVIIVMLLQHCCSLLVLGMDHYGSKEWAEIQEKLLPFKTPNQVHAQGLVPVPCAAGNRFFWAIGKYIHKVLL